MQILETARLRLRELTPEDAPFMLELLNTPGWLSNVGDRKVHTIAAATAYIEDRLVKGYREHGLGLWLMEIRDTGEPIGICGLIKRIDLDEVDVGFAVLPAFMRQGYTFEAADACIAYAADRFGIGHLLAITSPGNEASISLLLKLGFVFKEDIRFGETGEELKLFELIN